MVEDVSPRLAKGCKTYKIWCLRLDERTINKRSTGIVHWLFPSLLVSNLSLDPLRFQCTDPL